MAKYEYKGRSKIVPQIPKRKSGKQKHIIDQCSFLLLSSYPMANIKKLGCPLANDYYGEEVLDLHLDIIQSICKSPNIIIVGGFEIKRILKHSRRNEFQIVENTLHEFTNSSEDLRLGLNAACRLNTVVIDSTFLPSVETYKLLLTDLTTSKIVYSIRKSDCVGINITHEGIINFFGYGCENKIKGGYYLNINDFDRIRKKCTGSSFCKNKFDYEILEELKMHGILDDSKSFRLDENYDNKN
jgi:hypothetical protein